MTPHSSFTCVTARQYVALYLYYIEGQPQRTIGSILGVSQQAASYLLERGRRRLVTSVGETGVVKAVHMRELLRPSPYASPTRDLGKAASRQEDLLDALEQRMLQRADDLADLQQCMSGESVLPVRTKRNHFDQWECRYLSGNGVLVDPINDRDLPQGWHMEPVRKSRVPESAYRSDRAARYCASDPATCGLDCCGCRRSR